MAGERLCSGLPNPGHMVISLIGNDSFLFTTQYCFWGCCNYPYGHGDSQDNTFQDDSFTMQIYYKYTDTGSWYVDDTIYQVTVPDGGEFSTPVSTKQAARFALFCRGLGDGKWYADSIVLHGNAACYNDGQSSGRKLVHRTLTNSGQGVNLPGTLTLSKDNVKLTAAMNADILII